MQGTIFDIKHCAIHDGPGLRTTVFFKGCSLKCWWCHNPESIDPKPQTIQAIKKVGSNSFKEKSVIGYTATISEIMKEIEKDTIFFDESKGGVTFSGGEPLLQTEFLIELAKNCKAKSIHTALDTSGYIGISGFQKVMPYIDLFLFDIKLLDDRLHKHYTGVSNNKILLNLNLLISKGKAVIIRYPLIPGINNSEIQLEELKTFLSHKISEIHFLPYHTIARNKYKQIGMVYKMNATGALSDNYLSNLKTDFEQAGFKVKIGG